MDWIDPELWSTHDPISALSWLFAYTYNDCHLGTRLQPGQLPRDGSRIFLRGELLVGTSSGTADNKKKKNQCKPSKQARPGQPQAAPPHYRCRWELASGQTMGNNEHGFTRQLGIFKNGTDDSKRGQAATASSRRETGPVPHPDRALPTSTVYYKGGPNMVAGTVFGCTSIDYKPTPDLFGSTRIHALRTVVSPVTILETTNPNPLTPNRDRRLAPAHSAPGLADITYRTHGCGKNNGQ